MPLRSSDIKELLAPVKLLANKHALSAVYRTLELSHSMVRACASYGTIEIDMQLGIPTDQVYYVDAMTFLAVVDSLAAQEDLKLVRDKEALKWSCGSATGRLALAAIDQMPGIGEYPEGDPLLIPDGLKQALELGALSCDSMSLASMGMHGVVLDTRNESFYQLDIYSSDNITVSYSSIPRSETDVWPELITLTPPAAELLAEVLNKNGGLMFTDTSLYYWDEGTRLRLSLAAPLKHDLAKVVSQYAETEKNVALPTDGIAAFIKRVNALAESKKDSAVTLYAMDGQLALSFSENIAASDEYFLVKDLSIPEGQLEIRLDATRLARALAHVELVALDHVERNTIVFRGGADALVSFQYLVAGKK